MNRKLLWITLLLVLLEVALTAWAWPHMPLRIPVHLNAAGQADGWGSRTMMFTMNPGLLMAIGLLLSVLGWLSPEGFGLKEFQPVVTRICAGILVILVWVHCTMLWMATGHAGRMDRALLFAICLLFLWMGNLMGKLRRNFFIGIRTPWTLASDRVWNATHRLAAWTMVLGGLVGCILTLVTLPFVGLIVTIACSLIPIPYSLYYLKRLEARGELEADAQSELEGRKSPLGL